MQIASVTMLCIIAYGLFRDISEPYKKESDKVALQTVQDLANRSWHDARWVVFGSLVDQPHAPNMVPWGGSLARFRYDLLQHGPSEYPILWAPLPEEVPMPGEKSDTLLLMYHDNDQETNPFPEAQAKAYLDAVVSRLGEPTVETFALKEDSESVTVYRFPRARWPTSQWFSPLVWRHLLQVFVKLVNTARWQRNIALAGCGMPGSPF